jgi:Spy/CpxP family protein refolding chaperone
MTVSYNGWRARLIVVGIFALGFGLGALVMDLYQGRMIGANQRPGPPSVREEYSERLKRELALTEGQTHQVRQILDETRNEFMQLRNEMRPRFDEIRDHSRNRIRAALTPEQQARFDQLLKQDEEKRKKFHEGNKR